MADRGNGGRNRLPSIPRSAVSLLLNLFANRTLYGWHPKAWWAIVLELFKRGNGSHG